MEKPTPKTFWSGPIFKVRRSDKINKICLSLSYAPQWKAISLEIDTPSAISGIE
jgi:hypothetical protein